jgi:aminoglycoside phosphotransferase (APT) family kinase protein
VNALALEWLARAFGPDAVIQSVDPLPGATSASLFAIEASSRERPRRAVLRVLTNREWLRAEPDLASHEAAVLEALDDLRYPAPRLVAWTPDDDPFGAPAVLMSRIEGSVELHSSDRRAWVEALAQILWALHQLAPPALSWRFRSWTDPSALQVPPWTRHAALWQRAIHRLHVGVPAARPVLLHRDFHPANVLWRDGVVTGVVDWVNGCIGPAGVDVAHCALNLALMFGPTVASTFSDAYERMAGRLDDVAYWHVDAILGTLPDPTYYEPWRHFGLGAITREELRWRLETHLDRVLRST